MKRKILLLAMIAFIMLSCAQKKKQTEGDEGEVPKVLIFKYNDTYLNNYILLSGDVNPSFNVNVLPQTSGKVNKIFFDVGNYVKEGQIVAYIDPSRPGATYNLNPVKAPTSGTITSISGHIGDTINQGTPLMRISDIKNTEIETRISEKFLDKVHIGLRAEIKFDAFSDEKFIGEVFYTDPVLDPLTRTLKIKFKVDGKNKVKSGMFANITLAFPTDNPLLIPSYSILKKKNENYVYLITLNGITPKKIDILEKGEKIPKGFVEVKGGLSNGDEFIISDVSQISEEQRVLIDRELGYLELLELSKKK